MVSKKPPGELRQLLQPKASGARPRGRSRSRGHLDSPIDLDHRRLALILARSPPAHAEPRAEGSTNEDNTAGGTRGFHYHRPLGRSDMILLAAAEIASPIER